MGDRFEDYAKVVRLARELRERGNWCGATHLQKATYLLKHLTGVNVDYEFILYKHGPFSFDLKDATSAMLGEKLLKLEPQGPRYGPKLALGRRAKLLEEKYGHIADSHQTEIEFVADWLGDRGVEALERLATAFWVTQHGDGDASERAQRLKALKPHIDEEDARAAIAEIDDMIEAWEATDPA